MCFFFLFSSEPISGEGRWPAEPPFVAPPPEEEVGASLGSALVTVAGSLAISFAVHVGCSVGQWALKRGWAWRNYLEMFSIIIVNLVVLSLGSRRPYVVVKYYRVL